MKNKSFVLGTLAIVTIVFAFLLWQRPPAPTKMETPSEQKTSTVEDSTKSELFVRPHSPRFGNSMARVMVVEWLDPECESCREMHPITKKIIADYGDRVLFVIRYMPYHGSSIFAASVLEEARELGKFEQALTILFEKQPEWGSHHQPRPELIPGYLEKIGISRNSLNKEKIIAKHEKKILMDKDDGEKVGVRGTPSFFINQKPLHELGDVPLRAAIDAALAN